MQVERNGIILYVKEYKSCIEFYSNVLELEVMFQNKELTCFDFFGTYLMVEKEDREEYTNQAFEHKVFSCLRMNVNDVYGMTEALKRKGVNVDYQEHSWGKVAKFKDPDGNLIAFKDEEGFLKQIKDHKKKDE